MIWLEKCVFHFWCLCLLPKVNPICFLKDYLPSLTYSLTIKFNKLYSLKAFWPYSHSKAIHCCKCGVANIGISIALESLCRRKTTYKQRRSSSSLATKITTSTTWSYVCIVRCRHTAFCRPHSHG